MLSFALCATSCAGMAGDGEGDQIGEAVSLAFVPANTVGRAVARGNGLKHAFHSYDLRGRDVAAQHVLDGKSYVYATAYGFPCAADACTGSAAAPNGTAPISETFPDSEVVRYTFDTGGAQQSITTTPPGGTTQTIVSRVQRNARGQTIQVDYGDMTSTTHHYNDSTDLRLNQIETYLTASPSSILQLYTYGFDADGNVTAVNDYCNELSTGNCISSAANTVYSASYRYDARSQLSQTTRNGASYPYVYDGLGNLTNKENVAQTYFPSGAGKPHPHALSNVGAVSYAYDPNGNLVSTTGGTANLAVTWNADNMPVLSTYGAGGASNTKWFVGETMWKRSFVQSSRSAAVTTYYLPSMRVEGPSALRRKYFGSFAERDPSDTTSCTVNASAGCLKFYHGDHLGSSTLVTNAAGAIVHRQAFKPYGEDLAAVGTFTPKYQFNFKEKEPDTSGVYDYGARLYNPATGRFLSADTSDSDGLNRYSYVRNNPLTLLDPTGHYGQDPDDATYTKDFREQAFQQRLQQQKAPARDLNAISEFIAEAFSFTIPGASLVFNKIGNKKNTPGDYVNLALAFVPGGSEERVAAKTLGRSVSKQQAEQVIAKIAAKTERITNNKEFDTCQRAAIENSIRLYKAGFKPVISHLRVFGDDGHAFTEVDLGEHGMRYLSWGKVYTRLGDLFDDMHEIAGWDKGVHYERGTDLPTMLKEGYHPPDGMLDLPPPH
jgi:RHS repeat-associated protein